MKRAKLLKSLRILEWGIFIWEWRIINGNREWEQWGTGMVYVESGNIILFKRRTMKGYIKSNNQLCLMSTMYVVGEAYIFRFCFKFSMSTVPGFETVV